MLEKSVFGIVNCETELLVKDSGAQMRLCGSIEIMSFAKLLSLMSDLLFFATVHSMSVSDCRRLDVWRWFIVPVSATSATCRSRLITRNHLANFLSKVSIRCRHGFFISR